MRNIVYFLALVWISLISLEVFAQTGFGKITGTVVTEDNQPAEGVTIVIVGTDYATAANARGRFGFNKLNPGNYTLKVSLVGYNDVEKEAVVTEGATTSISIVLGVNARELSEVIVTGRKNGLHTQTASSSLRVQTPLLELPQNVQVITGRVLSEQQIISTSDGLLRNVSGLLRAEHWGDLYTNVNMRGSRVQAFRNGFNVVNSSWGPLTEDMSMVERVEFVKGPAGFMLGTGEPGGLYNVVTKKPTGENKGEVSFAVGSYDLYRGTIDLDRKLTADGKLLFRFNG